MAVARAGRRLPGDGSLGDDGRVGLAARPVDHGPAGGPPLAGQYDAGRRVLPGNFLHRLGRRSLLTCEMEMEMALPGVRERAGDRKSAEILARQAADHGETTDPLSTVVLKELFQSMWPYGLDTDGTPTPRWR
ncbi:hypothetical protein ACF1GW_06135 [Streptomyces achromogenes]|uniref:hypothetical protein n=1 Tax=Streptomyces achromogenes TaxID=67255 RepID=UPI0036FEEBC8